MAITPTETASEPTWPADLRVAQVRVARPTDKLAEVERFYAGILGLPVLYRFSDHAGFDGVMLGLPGSRYHLEFTSSHSGSPCPAPSKENLLVLYFETETAMYDVVERLAGHGCEPVPAENPYWTDHGALSFEDPDGWRVVLVPKPVVL
ncbi:VOC family protein [Mycolicibacterium smegmatis]|uniref:VOC family protein n=1 Tax=Mycolicibacterium smegmatis TaxID=1772 RepID=UPI0020A61122|nr:VOC family protein [Mycolicibacterium smegmatis]MCP2622243.1 VOC family protein [Mycolicibacterium smegmatis]MCP2622580.1 VOC family protein [Mycolicibacterium smegmatis]